MEHIIIREIDDVFFELKAEKPYRLFSKQLNRVVSEAVVKKDTINNFIAIE